MSFDKFRDSYNRRETTVQEYAAFLASQDDVGLPQALQDLLPSAPEDENFDRLVASGVSHHEFSVKLSSIFNRCIEDSTEPGEPDREVAYEELHDLGKSTLSAVASLYVNIRNAFEITGVPELPVEVEERWRGDAKKLKELNKGISADHYVQHAIKGHGFQENIAPALVAFGFAERGLLSDLNYRKSPLLDVLITEEGHIKLNPNTVFLLNDFDRYIAVSPLAADELDAVASQIEA